MTTPRKAIYYDTETTGIRSDKDRIIEIAAYEPETGREFVRLICPGIPIPAEATAIHHITDEMVANAPSFAVIGAEFLDFCGPNPILVAHNNDAFDQKFIAAELERHQLSIPTDWRFVDSLKWARRYRPDLPRHTLQFLREIYTIPANNAHRALDDVIVLHKVFEFMTDNLTIDEVFALLNQPRSLQHMPFGKHQGKPLNQIPASYVEWLAGSGALDKPENSELKESFIRLGLLAHS